MENTYRQVSCPQCGQKLRLTIKGEENLGGLIKVTCAKCGEKFETVLPLFETPPEVVVHQEETEESGSFNQGDLGVIRPLIREFGETLHRTIMDNAELACIVEKFRAAGYDPTLIFDATLGFSREKNGALRKPAPLVKNGEIVPGAFSSADGAWMKDFHINLDTEK